MQLREFAESILFEPSLERKLVTPLAGFTDSTPGPALVSVPQSPGRPPELLLPTEKHQKSKHKPRFNQFESERERGLTLHAFANHELLALELMALALLRFPDAPTSFRMGLARTMLDEQKHLRLYQKRMQALGVTLGEAPVNRFFWDCLKDMTSPLAFVARMSLTLEQANLDFATHFEQVFRSLGDVETAQILAEVHQDEIGHVKHGVIWFNRWRNPNQSEWEAYREQLQMPLSPIRAKGPVFQTEARLAAGLSADFIETLAHFNSSKGRPPTLFWFNAGWEEELIAAMRMSSTMVQDPVLNKVTETIERDLDALMLFVAKSDDIVWLRRKPSSHYLAGLRAAGIRIPQLVTQIKDLDHQQLERFEPWGMSRRARHFAASLPVQFRHNDERPDTPIYASKVWAAHLPESRSFPVRICRTLTEVRSSLFVGFSVIKAPLGASGRHAQRVSPTGLTQSQEHWVQTALKTHGQLIVEPWVDRIADFSVQLEVGRQGNPVIGITRFLTNRQGQYLGHILRAPYAGLDQAVIRTFYERNYLGVLEQTGQAVAKALIAAGHHGPAGVDAFLYRTDSGDLALRPLVEINARYTMGRIALAIERYLHPSSQAIWLHIPRRKLDLKSLLANHPPQVQAGRLVRGALPTNDPEGVELLQTILFVGPSCADSHLPAPSSSATNTPRDPIKKSNWLHHWLSSDGASTAVNGESFCPFCKDVLRDTLATRA